MRKLLLPFLLLLSLKLSAQVQMVKILPSATDTAINSFSGQGYLHFVYFDKATVKPDQLLVFLTGTNGRGEGPKGFNEFAASLGYRVINLIYPDNFSLSRYQRSEDMENYARGREEIITGKDLSEQIHVNRANSIENRLYKLLVDLNRRFPKRGWSAFYNNKTGEIIWDKITLAGQSQGGGHAAFIAKQHKVARVLMFGSPKDYSVRYNKAPAWISEATETPLNRYFSFVHSKDDHNACTYSQQQEIWRAFGLYKFGNEADVDKDVPPYHHVRLLTSTRPQPVPHVAPIRDIAYKAAWQYMLTEKVTD